MAGNPNWLADVEKYAKKPKRRNKPREWPKWYAVDRRGLRALDTLLEGCWWRCERHGLSDRPVFFAECLTAYCPADECAESMILVASSAWGGTKATGREKFNPSVATKDQQRRKRRKATSQRIDVEEFKGRDDSDVEAFEAGL